MKVIILAEDTIIDGRLRVAGEAVTVPDSFTKNIRRVVKEAIEVTNKAEFEQIKERLDPGPKEGNGGNNPK